MIRDLSFLKKKKKNVAETGIIIHKATNELYTIT